jgi:hypothetical protein
MRCDEAERALYAGEAVPELEIHLSACDECRLLAQDLAGLKRAFARAKSEWAPSPAFRVPLPAVDWRRLAAAACLLLLPLAGAAGLSLRSAASAGAAANLSVILEPAAPPTPSDREILATLLLSEDQP